MFNRRSGSTADQRPFLAGRFGFTGGLVGGVHVYAYMTHLPLAHWGRVWLERGTGDCKFGKPVLHCSPPALRDALVLPRGALSISSY